MLRVLKIRSLNLILTFLLTFEYLPWSAEQDAPVPVHLSPASYVQTEAVQQGEAAGTLAGLGVGMVTGSALSNSGSSNPNSKPKVASWRTQIQNGINRAKASLSQINEQPYIVKPTLLTTLLAPLFALAAIISLTKAKITRRKFIAAVGGMTATASIGCATPGRDHVTDAQIYQNFDIDLPSTLNFSLERFLGDAVKLNMGLRRVFFDYYLIDEVKPRADEGAGDIKITASISAIFNASTTPNLAAGLFASGDFYVGNWNMAYQTHDRQQSGDFNTVPANLTAATIANDATGALNSINPELYYTIPLIGGTSVSNPDEAVKEAIRAKFRHEMNKVVHEVSQAYWKIVELKRDKLFLQQQKALIEAIPAAQRPAALTTKLGEINTAIADIELPLRSAYLALIAVVGYRSDQFSVRKRQVVIEPQESILLQFDPDDINQVPVINEDQSLERMRNNSVEYVRLTQQMNIAEDAIGAAKYNASRPNVTLAFGFEPRNAGLVGFLAEFHPWRFRLAEAQIMELRTKFLGFTAAREEVLNKNNNILEELLLNREFLIRRITTKRDAFTRLDSNLAALRGYLINSSGRDITPSQVQTNVQQALSSSQLTVDQINNLVQLLEAKRAFQSEIRKFNHLESSRFLLEGELADDEKTGRTLSGLKDYFNPFINQPAIYFHNLFRGGVKMFWWIMAGIGTAIATTLFPGTALASTSRVSEKPPAVRWSAPEFAPVYREPAFAASI